MSTEKKIDHTQAIQFIEDFKIKNIDASAFEVKHGDGWDYEADALESVEKMDDIIDAILSISLEGRPLLKEIQEFYKTEIQKKIKAKNSTDQIFQLMKRYDIIDNAINAILIGAKEVMEIHHEYDSLGCDLRRYIQWIQEKEELEERTKKNG